MAKKPIFDQDAAFKSIIGMGTPTSETEHAIPADAELTAEPSRTTAPSQKGRPKSNRETKKRISLAIYPSVYNNLQRIAYVKRQSTSDVITRLVMDYVNANADALEEYTRMTGEE